MLAASVGSVLLLVVGSPRAGATPEDGQDPGQEPEAEAELSEEEQLRIDELQEGAAVYSRTCSSCHQPGGTGLEGQYPPLLDNPRVDDTEYLIETINQGRRGELEVAGVVYDGVMPAFSTLPDAEVAAVVAYLQNGLQAPVSPDGESASGPLANTSLPRVSLLTSSLAFLTFVSLVGLVLSPFVVTSRDRLHFPVLDAWLRSVIIVVVAVAATIFIPNLVLTAEPVAGLSRSLQDLIGTVVFGGCLLAVLAGLWWAHGRAKV